jgi:predicted secreted protein
MSVTQGTSGFFSVGHTGSTGLVGEMNRFTITKTSDPIDVSVFGTRWKKFVNGSVGWNISLSGFADCEDSGQEDLEDSIDDGTPVTVYCHTDDDTYRYGSAYVTNFTVEDTHDGVATVSIDAQGTEELHRVCGTGSTAPTGGTGGT